MKKLFGDVNAWKRLVQCQKYLEELVQVLFEEENEISYAWQYKEVLKSQNFEDLIGFIDGIMKVSSIYVEDPPRSNRDAYHLLISIVSEVQNKSITLEDVQ